MRTLIFLFFIIPALSFGQFFSKTYQTREVILDHNDSLIVFDIVSEKVDIELDNSKVYYWYNSKEIKKNMGGYAGYLLHNNYKVYSSNKSLIEKGAYYLGTKDGEWKTWNKKGGLLSVRHYSKGKLDGESIEYNPYGKIIRHQQFKDGFLVSNYINSSDSTAATKQPKKESGDSTKEKVNILNWFKSKKNTSEEFDD